MRSLYSKDELLIAVAKKKPRLQDLIDQVGKMTDQEIDEISEPLWIKEALKTLKTSNGVGQKQRLQSIMNSTIESENLARDLPPPIYEVRIWDGDPTFIGGPSTISRVNSFQIEIVPGDPILILDDYQIKVQDSVISSGYWERTAILYNSKPVDYMTLENYRGLVRYLLNQKYKNI